MKILFEANCIKYGEENLDLDEINNNSLFLLLEYIVKNKEDIELELSNPKPFCKKIYDYINASLTEKDVDFEMF